MGILEKAKLEFEEPTEVHTLDSQRTVSFASGGSVNVPPVNVGVQRSVTETETRTASLARIAEDKSDRFIVYISHPRLLAYRPFSFSHFRNSRYYLTDEINPGSLLLIIGQIAKAKDQYYLSNDSEILYGVARKVPTEALKQYDLFDIEIQKTEVLPPRRLFFNLTGPWAAWFKYEALPGVLFCRVIGFDNKAYWKYICASRLEIIPLAIFSLPDYRGVVRSLLSKTHEEFTGDIPFPSLSFVKLSKNTKLDFVKEFEEPSHPDVTASRLLSVACAKGQIEHGQLKQFARIFSKATATSMKELQQIVSILSQLGQDAIRRVNDLAISLAMSNLFTYAEIERSVLICYRWLIASLCNPGQMYVITQNVYECSDSSKIAFFPSSLGREPYIAYVPSDVLDRYGLRTSPGRKYPDSYKEQRDLLTIYIIPQNYERITREMVTQSDGGFGIEFYAFD